MKRAITSLQLVRLPAPPNNPEEGDTYYDETLDKGRIFNGTEWINFPAETQVFPGGLDTYSIGVEVTPIMESVLAKPEATVGVEVVHHKYDLAHRSGSNGVTNTTVSVAGWSNPSNAEGRASSTATSDMVHGPTELRIAFLTMLYADFIGKSELTISSVKLHYYVSTSGTVSGNGDLKLVYRLDGSTVYGGTTLETITGNVSNLSSPRTFDITAAIGGDWSLLDNLVCFVRGEIGGLDTGVSYAVNAVELEVNASQTILL